jgi:hypothetical protein
MTLAKMRCWASHVSPGDFLARTSAVVMLSTLRRDMNGRAGDPTGRSGRPS